MTGAEIGLCGLACLGWTLWEFGGLLSREARTRRPRARRSQDGAALGFRVERRSDSRRASDRRSAYARARASAGRGRSRYGSAGAPASA